jgi:hypothetical protein
MKVLIIGDSPKVKSIMTFAKTLKLNITVVEDGESPSSTIVPEITEQAESTEEVTSVEDTANAAPPQEEVIEEKQKGSKKKK